MVATLCWICFAVVVFRHCLQQCLRRPGYPKEGNDAARLLAGCAALRRNAGRMMRNHAPHGSASGFQPLLKKCSVEMPWACIEASRSGLADLMGVGRVENGVPENSAAFLLPSGGCTAAFLAVGGPPRYCEWALTCRSKTSSRKLIA